MKIGLAISGISVLVLLAGIASIYFGRKNQNLALASGSWPQTTGTVRSVNVTKHERGTSDHSYTAYQPRIKYSYEVGGTAYTGQRLGLEARK